MARTPTSAVRAVVQFAMAGLATLALLTGAGVFASRAAARGEAVWDARQSTRTLTSAVIGPALDPGLFTGDPAAVAVLDRAVRRHVIGDGIVRVKVWRRDGRILYSDEPRLIGMTFRLQEDELASLADGRVIAEVSDLSAPENLYERDQDKLLEVYLPASVGTELVLVETYSRYAQVSERTRALFQTFVPITAGLLLLLQLVQLPLAASLARRLERGRQEREALLQRAITASDTERRRIAADLHDGVVQDLAGVSYSLAGTADRVARRGDGAAAGALYDAAAGVRQSMRALRSLLVEIYPPNLQAAGLPAAISDLVAPLAGRGLAVEVDVPGNAGLAVDREALAFRVAQEAVRNAVQHAGASRLALRLETRGSRAVLTVADDGAGFDPSVPAADGHVGLRLLADLAADAGAALTVTSAPGAGTTVRLELPLP